MTWVIADFTATCAGQVSVTKGQQVELVDCFGGISEMVLVRVPSDCTEGMVPHIVLKQPPSLKSPLATGEELEKSLISCLQSRIHPNVHHLNVLNSRDVVIECIHYRLRKENSLR